MHNGRPLGRPLCLSKGYPCSTYFVIIPPMAPPKAKISKNMTSGIRAMPEPTRAILTDFFTYESTMQTRVTAGMPIARAKDMSENIFVPESLAKTPISVATKPDPIAPITDPTVIEVIFL